MKETKANLEGKIDASIGDLILIENSHENTEISGYVVELKYKTITLSHENPARKVEWCYCGRRYPTRGDRKYNLNGFTNYEILKKPR